MVNGASESISADDSEKLRFVVEEKDDLNVRVERSSFCKINFFPIDVEMEPTEFTRPFVSNIEGLLNRLEKTLSFVEDNEEKKEILGYIQEVRSGEKELIIELEDPTGKSFVGEKDG